MALAAALARRGVDCRVFERSAGRSAPGAGMTMWPDAVRVLDELGAGGGVRRRAWPITLSRVMTPAGRVLSTTPVGQVSALFGSATYAVRRSVLHEELARRVPGDWVETGAACVGVRGDERGATITLDDGRDHAADVVIGADGIRSRVREFVAGPIPPREVGCCLWRGIARIADGSLRRGEAFETWGRGVRFGMVQVSADEVYWYAGLRGAPREDFERVRPRLLRVFGSWHAPIAGAIGATEPAEAVRTTIRDIPPAARWVRGRVALLGDAAHAMTPDLGQGGCTALEDASRLAELLASGATPEAALAAYESLRRPVCERLAQRSRRVTRMAQWSNPVLCAARAAGAALMSGALAARALTSMFEAASVVR